MARYLKDYVKANGWEFEKFKSILNVGIDYASSGCLGFEKKWLNTDCSILSSYRKSQKNVCVGGVGRWRPR